jgi:hypothetical protein
MMLFDRRALEEPEPFHPPGEPAASRGCVPTLRASVGCRPHARPKEAGRSRHAVAGDTTPGRRLCPGTWDTSPLQTFAVMGAITGGKGRERVTGTCVAIAPRHPPRARAMATTPWVACGPRAIRRRSRVPRRTWACQLRSWRAVGGPARRRWRGRLTVAGWRDAQAPATHARRAWVWPAVVLAPCRRRAPRDDAAGLRPQHVSRCLG